MPQLSDRSGKHGQTKEWNAKRKCNTVSLLVGVRKYDFAIFWSENNDTVFGERAAFVPKLCGLLDLLWRRE